MVKEVNDVEAAQEVQEVEVLQRFNCVAQQVLPTPAAGRRQGVLQVVASCLVQPMDVTNRTLLIDEHGKKKMQGVRGSSE